MTTELKVWQELADTTDLRWPEWEEELVCRGFSPQHALRWSKSERWVVGWLGTDSGKFLWLHRVTDHEAACLFERHARTWLEERGIGVNYIPEDGAYVAYRPPDYLYRMAGRALFVDPMLASPALDNTDAQWAEWAAALQAAVRAVAKEGKGSPCKQ